MRQYRLKESNGIKPGIVDDDSFVLLLVDVALIFISYCPTSVELMSFVFDIDCGFVNILLADVPSISRVDVVVDGASSICGDDARSRRLRPATNDLRGDIGTTMRRLRYCCCGLMFTNNADAAMKMEEDIIIVLSLRLSLIMMQLMQQQQDAAQKNAGLPAGSQVARIFGGRNKDSTWILPRGRYLAGGMMTYDVAHIIWRET